MIIQCDQCQTKFKLPDEKLKPAGVKVRCSHCKHVFTVMPPEPMAETAPEPEKQAPAPPQSEPEPEPEPEKEQAPSGSEEADVEETKTSEAEAEKESAEAPGSGMEFDFGDFSETPDEEDFAAEREGQAGESSELDFSSAFEEDESAFSAEEPSEGKTDFDFGDEETAEQEESAFDFGEEKTGEQEKPPLDFGAEETGGSEEAGEFDYGEDKAEPSEFDLGEEPEPEPEDFGFGEETGPSDEFEFDEGDEQNAGEGDEFGFGEEGSGTEPDAFDFGEEDPFAEEEPAEAPAPDEDKQFKFTELTGDEKEESGAEASSAESFAPPAAGSEPSGSGYSEEEPMPDEAAPEPSVRPGKKPGGKKAKESKGPISRVLLLVFVLLLVLTGGVGYFYWQQGELGLPAVDNLIARLTGGGVAALAEANIEIADQSGRYVTNEQAGTLLVIEGRAVNRHPESRANIRVQATLYDAGGNALRRQKAYCGNPLTDEQLRSLSFARIEGSMDNAFGEALSNTDVPPGKSLPFTIVFKDLPENLDSFSVEALGSQPGSGQ